MKTIIASMDQKDAIMRDLASKNNGILKDIQIQSLNTLLKEEKDDAIVLSMQLSSLLHDHQEQFPIYQAMFSYPAFIQEILSFTKECILYQIDANDLPETNANEKELKQIIQIALTLDISEKKSLKKKKNILQNLDTKNITLHHQFIRDTYHYNIFQQLKENCDVIDYPMNKPAVSIHYALNARSEAESIAQDICKHNQPCNVILSSSASISLYESVFQRYGIPFSSLRTSKELHLPKIFKTLIQLGIKKDRNSLLEAFKQNAFEKQIDADSYAFFQQTLVDISMPNNIPEGASFDIFVRETKQFKEKFEKAQNYYDCISEDLYALVNYNDPTELIYHAFSILQKSPYLQQKAELTIGIQMRKTIIECIPLIQTLDDALFLARALENDKVDEQILNSDFCILTDLTHPVDPRKITYVTSVSGANYPGVPKCTGLFDESYLEKVTKYPHQNLRYEMYMHQLSWIENSAIEQLIYSYYTNDYQGHDIQLAFDIENKYHMEQTKWELISLEPAKKKEHVLDPSLAEKLFLKEGKITGSISTIERYFMCPYSYFIQSGLKIYPEDEPRLDAASVGTIQHKIFESSVHDYSKKYAEINEEQIRSYLEPSFELLDVLHPTNTSFNKITKDRIVQGVLLSCAFLKDFESCNSFTPEKVEYRFSEDITEHVHLVGIIDRIDEYRNEMLRIIDLKSSSKTLSEPKVKAGVQLQLLSYLMIAKKLFHKTPAGAYYFSLKEEAYSVEAKKVSKKELIETEWNEEVEQTRTNAQRKLSGWTFTDRTTELDESGTHISSLNRQKDYDTVEKWILDIYDYFYEHIINGEIDLSPDENACLYCQYRSICRFHGEKRKIKPIIKEEEDANTAR